MAVDVAKISILKAMEDRKDILFGQFSRKITKPVKDEAWNEISEMAKKLSVLKEGKNAQYFRDTVWQNWRRKAVQKRDNSRHTGAGGSKKNKMTEDDEIIYRIIGNESKVLDGLDIPESSGSCKSILSPTKPQSVEAIHTDSVEVVSTASQQPLKKRRYSCNSKVSTDPNTGENAIRKQQLKIEWLDLQCQLTRKELQLKDKDLLLRNLQIIKMQRELDIDCTADELIEENYEEA